MNPASLPDPVQPLLGTDITAFVLGLAAMLYAALWRRDRERGMGWFAISMALFAAFLLADRQHYSTGILLRFSPWFLVLSLALASLGLGLVDYLRVPDARRRLALWAALLPPAVFAALDVLVGLTGIAIVRAWANLLIGACLLVLGSLAWGAARREPGAGHGWVGVALLGVPALTLVLAATRQDAVVLRYWGTLPLIVLALTLLTVSLLRRRRALEAEVRRRSAAEAELTHVNASLEALVAQRIADLQDMVAGLESFNRSVSHDLRGSLGGIAGAARMADDALQRGDATLARRVLPLIAGQADDSTRLIAALLSLARVGDAVLQCRTVDLRELIEGVVEQLRREQSGQPLPRIEIEATVQVSADPALLERVFANLIGNAIKFTRGVPDGRVVIGASSGDGQIEVQVRDNGVGFDAAAAANLFKPFVRLHGMQFDGHGIGLSIVRRAIERHGGRVWAESAPGQGAVFRFSLPD